MKYIIDIPKTVGMTEKVGSVHCTYFDGIQCQTIILKSDEIEELNSDYINEHFSDLQDTAYQQGLEDAWECAKKLFSTMSDTEIEKVFPVEWKSGFSGLMQMKPQYAIEKLKAYEEKQNDKIEVGDEVLWFMKGDDEGCDDIMDVCAPSVVTMVPNKECDDYTIIESSGAMTVISKEQIYKKTGRHFDIASILEHMRND